MTVTTIWTDRPTHRAWLDHECRRLLGFGPDVVDPRGGAVWLDDDGRPDPGQGLQTWVTCRMVHVHGLGLLLGVPGSGPRAAGALAGLGGPLYDADGGGWFHALDAEGRPDLDSGRSCYDHAFVLLATSTATVAGLPAARELFTEAQQTFTERFWDEDAGRCVDSWDGRWTAPEDYRGLNSCMHAVEAMLSVADAVDVVGAAGADGAVWRDRAARIAGFVVELAAAHDDRLPEHFSADWAVEPEYNADRPDDPFKPYGATVGHGLEWARLLLHTEAALGDRAPDGLADTAERLFDRAVRDGWEVDGAPGFVYTTDWSGTPVVRDRMHWVAAEAIAAAAALHRRFGHARYAHWYATWWDYAATHLLDRDRGSWHHELDTANRPSATVWRGKPDLYHAVQATLLPRLPAAPMLARAVADGLPG